MKALTDTQYIRQLVSEGEHCHQDFKFEISDARKIARSLSAFANTEGGRLLIGVKDNGKIAGVRSDEVEGRENEKDLSMPGSPEHTANASLYFEKGGLNLRLSYNFASDFIDEMGESTFYDRYYDKVNYMDVNASYTFGKKFKTTFYAEANNLLNQPLRYYQGTKDRTMQAEYYGVKVNAGVKINF